MCSFFAWSFDNGKLQEVVVEQPRQMLDQVAVPKVMPNRLLDGFLEQRVAAQRLSRSLVEQRSNLDEHGWKDRRVDLDEARADSNGSRLGNRIAIAPRVARGITREPVDHAIVQVTIARGLAEPVVPCSIVVAHHEQHVIGSTYRTRRQVDTHGVGLAVARPLGLKLLELVADLVARCEVAELACYEPWASWRSSDQTMVLQGEPWVPYEVRFLARRTDPASQSRGEFRPALGADSVSRTELDLYAENAKLKRRVLVLATVMRLLLALGPQPAKAKWTYTPASRSSWVNAYGVTAVLGRLKRRSVSRLAKDLSAASVQWAGRS